MKCPHCGSEIDGKSKPRSSPQLRRFFGMLRAMYQHWPASAEFQPESEEHLRKYSICGAGFRDSTDVAVPFAEDQPGLTKLVAISVEACVRGAGGFAFIRPHPDGGMVRVYKAKSIAFDKLGQAEFNRLNEAVEAFYFQETGLDPNQVFRESAASA